VIESSASILARYSAIIEEKAIDRRSLFFKNIHQPLRLSNNQLDMAEAASSPAAVSPYTHTNLATLVVDYWASKNLSQQGLW
jgi:hypothetical protein